MQRNIVIMMKPSSGKCNMRCRYCFYSDLTARRQTPDYGFMTEETARAVADAAFAEADAHDTVTFSFQGGEPTLRGIEFYEHFFAYVNETYPHRTVSYAFQTNGLLIDEDWCELFKKHQVLVGLSIDAKKTYHDRNRVDASGSGTYTRIIKGKSLLDRYGVDYNVLMVITQELARHPQDVMRFILDNKLTYVQFIPCLDELGATSRSIYAVTPERLHDFYVAMFELWVRELSAGHPISIKLFDDLINYYYLGMPTACGINGQCSLQLVIESDGSCFPCDFYMLDEFRLGSIAETPLEKLGQTGLPFMSYGREYAAEAPCSSCRYSASCRGGCKRMKDAMYIQDGYCWYAKTLDEILEPLIRIARRLKH